MGTIIYVLIISLYNILADKTEDRAATEYLLPHCIC